MRKAITKALGEVSGSRMTMYELEYLLRGVAEAYLQRWSCVLRSEPGKISTEQASRFIAGHLLGLGFSLDKLHRWATWLEKARQPETLGELFEEAEVFAQIKKRTWSVFVPFRVLGQHEQTMPREWLDPGSANLWLAEHAKGIQVRHNGGFVLTANALDPWAAVEEVGDLIESLGNRIAVGLPENPRFKPLSNALVAGFDWKFSLGRPGRRVEIHSLKRHDALFALGKPGLAGRLRSAIDLGRVHALSVSWMRARVMNARKMTSSLS